MSEPQDAASESNTSGSHAPLAGRSRGDETLGVLSAVARNLIGAVSPNVRLVREPGGTLDCCFEHVSQNLEITGSLDGTCGW